jgi:hypothetical protein
VCLAIITPVVLKVEKIEKTHNPVSSDCQKICGMQDLDNLSREANFDNRTQSHMCFARNPSLAVGT